MSWELRGGRCYINGYPLTRVGNKEKEMTDYQRGYVKGLTEAKGLIQAWRDDLREDGFNREAALILKMRKELEGLIKEARNQGGK